MKFLKSFIGAVIILAATFTTQAQQLQSLVSLAANTASNIVSGAYVIDNFIAINATTNAATIQFYDSSNTSTTMVQAAYTSYTQYATNYSTVITNESGFVYTNSFSGIYTAPVANTISTNTRPSVQILLVPAGVTLNKDVKLMVMRGLVAVPTQAITLLTTYRRP